MKKRIFSGLLVLCLVFTLIPSTAFAAVNDIFTAYITVGKNTNVSCTFKILKDPSGGNNGTVQIGEGVYKRVAINQGTSGILTIPQTVTSGGKTYDVTAIGDSAFYECGLLSGNLTIPDSVTAIGTDAFYKCRVLSGNLTIPDSVTTIGNNAFYFCEGFDGTLSLSENVGTISEYAFAACKKLRGDLIISNNVTTIGTSAFQSCQKLNTVTIPKSVKSIDAYAFSGCQGLTKVDIGVVKISNNLFAECRGLTELIIQEGVKEIGASAFFSCEKLGKVTIPASVNMIKKSAFDNCGVLKPTLNFSNALGEKEETIEFYGFKQFWSQNPGEGGRRTLH